MALPAGRVGVKKTDVDWQGNVKGGGGSSDTYTKAQIDSKFGGLTFRDNEGTPQVKTADGEWVNFNSGGGVDIFDMEFTSLPKNDPTFTVEAGKQYILIISAINEAYVDSCVTSVGTIEKTKTLGIDSATRIKMYLFTATGGTFLCYISNAYAVYKEMD